MINFWWTLEIPLIKCEITPHMTWSKHCILLAGTAANQNLKVKITGTKPYVPVVTLWTQGNVKLLKQLEFGFKRTVNWNKHQPKTRNQALSSNCGNKRL